MAQLLMEPAGYDVTGPSDFLSGTATQSFDQFQFPVSHLLKVFFKVSLLRVLLLVLESLDKPIQNNGYNFPLDNI